MSQPLTAPLSVPKRRSDRSSRIVRVSVLPTVCGRRLPNPAATGGSADEPPRPAAAVKPKWAGSSPPTDQGFDEWWSWHQEHLGRGRLQRAPVVRRVRQRGPPDLGGCRRFPAHRRHAGRWTLRWTTDPGLPSAGPTFARAPPPRYRMPRRTSPRASDSGAYTGDPPPGRPSGEPSPGGARARRIAMGWSPEAPRVVGDGDVSAVFVVGHQLVDEFLRHVAAVRGRIRCVRMPMT